ncbi:LOW QUALITY PROTEIN: hypothetical protein BRADI_1g17750v3 [Brachypodium distachyon]|uniref:F-box domain-containing protein n=1 Tax=Brachypodium distachyon TaxID=15368 RepID=A0A0Q3KU28_BRADI|nr:LOW QUALITY PROTEIN: hypothetical protein BRADI_1g17750v3 [Brachypodium distachyon]
MAAADRLSVLPDGMLHRILSFTPSKEAAASSALSRGWRPLWRQTTGINLDSRRYSPQPTDRRFSSNDVPKYDAFFSDAHAAFRTRRRQIQRLTLFLEIGTYRLGKAWWHCRRRDEPEPEDDGTVAGLLSDPAVAGLEELRIGCQQAVGIGNQVDYYSPQLASLPCAATLRVLELRRCKLESPLALHLPRLTGLHLHNCFLQEGGTLQVLVDAAPELTSLSLVDVLHKAPASAPVDVGSAEKRPYYDHDTATYVRLPLRLRCPALTAFLLLINVNEKDSQPDADSGIELDMPSLRFFRYRGFPVKLSLTSSAPALELVDIDVSHQGSYFWKLEPTSGMLRSFSSMRTLKLRLDLIEDIVVAGDAEEGGVILPTFPNLKLVELDAEYQYIKSDATAAAMAWLLRSCPAMAELRLRLNMQWDYGYDQKAKAARPVGGPLGKSMERFQRLASMSTTHRGVVELGEVSELPAAMTSNCTCLRTSLRKVTLQFKAKEVNCFQVQLAKFLAENAMVLEEMHVENGSWFWPDHLCHKVARWRAESFKRRNLTDTAGFRVYQLPARKPSG